MSGVSLDTLMNLLQKKKSPSVMKGILKISGEKVNTIINGEKIGEMRLANWRKKIPDNIRQEMIEFWNIFVSIKAKRKYRLEKKLFDQNQINTLLTREDNQKAYIRSHLGGMNRTKVLKEIVGGVVEDIEIIRSFVKNQLRDLQKNNGGGTLLIGRMAIFIGGSTILGPRDSVDSDVDIYVMIEGLPLDYHHTLGKLDLNNRREYQIVACSPEKMNGSSPFHITLHPNLLIASEYTESDIAAITDYQLSIVSSESEKKYRSEIKNRLIFEVQ